MFTMVAFLSHEPELSADALEKRLREYFHEYDGVTITRDRLPTNDDDSIILRWDEWRVRLSPETRGVSADAIDIAQELGEAAPPGLATWSRWVRAVFGDDPERMYTDQIIEVMEFLKALPGAIVFDPQRRDVLQ
jgi:hypothetical protein